ncbi:hypothetical protein CMI47_19865 [Candidatus Pacearchaeota archaeon]|nr:hypothetical protein [Candidatus Pacearchaeota archaeon]|tara:strand:+ start:279 stop:566 length:288 start_codon:yes stop_codon:yes gene_type:complete
MGFLNKSTYVIDAILTKKAREHLRTAILGQNQNDEHVIVKFALSDDEVDYGLWEDNPDSSGNIAQGDVISNQPLTEPTFNSGEMMKYLLYKNKDM